MATPMRIVIVDDEISAIRNLREVIDTFPELEVIAEIRDGRTAVKELHRLQPDVLFLDIEMPEFSGFEVATATENLGHQLVFVTAFDQYALEAFSTSAIDYLVKPVRPRLIRKCIEKILRQSRVSSVRFENSRADEQRITLSDSDGIRILDIGDIAFLEGVGRYRRIHLTASGVKSHRVSTILSDTTLDDFEQALSHLGFFRVHRGYIARLSLISRIHAESRRHFAVLQGVNEQLPIARGRVTELRAKIRGYSKRPARQHAHF